MRRLLGLLLLGGVSLSASAGEIATAGGGLRFLERFVWAGDHAATTGDHGTTVWWDAHSWDVRGDTQLLAVASLGKGFHIDTHRAFSAVVSDGRIANAHAVGGDGSPGVGIMHTDYQSIVSARLRNPMLIAPGRPGIVTFWAPRSVTAEHSWEVAVTPADVVVGAEYTSVPTESDPLETPLTSGVEGTPGPGHRPAEASVNFIAAGYAGGRLRFGVTSTVGGETRDFVTKRASVEELLSAEVADRDKLEQWRLEFHPDRVVLLAQRYAGTGEFEEVDTFPATIPWSEVYVHFLGVAHQGGVRELQWRDITVEPVSYAATVVTPRDRAAGWMSFDLRDTQRFGAGQPNPGPYDRFTSFAYSAPQTQRIDLTFTRPIQFGVLARAQLLYDIRGAGATLFVNGTRVGVLPPASSVQAAEGEEWVHRSIDVPVALLR